MAHESFEDAEVAKYLNDYYISIKVDKEERPDIDGIYMNACIAYTGSGGWPTTILMTPDQKPFFAGTYFPKSSRYNMPGLMNILETIKKMWGDERPKLLQSSEQLVEMIKDKETNNNFNHNLTKEIFHKAQRVFERTFDRKYGGFGSNPKFPTPHNLLFLLRYYFFENNKLALEMVDKTLEQMYKGGIFDHVGYGFSRYSTDNKWLIPHFEKMLYDNALLTIVYVEAYLVTKNNLYKKIIDKTLQYVERELLSEDGGFYCAQDADSEGVEGKYYSLSIQEVIEVLGKEDGEWFIKHYNFSDKGNFEGLNIPNLINTPDFQQETSKIVSMQQKLLEYRLKRYELHKDDKILVSWNSLMIIAYAKAYRALGNEKYLEIAEKAFRFIQNNLVDEKNNIYSTYRHSPGEHLGTIDDYVFLLWALIELYETTFHIEYLRLSLKLFNKMQSEFWDNNNGGYYIYSNSSEQLITRPKEVYDGAIPSGNSVATYCLSKLFKLTFNTEVYQTLEKQVKYITNQIYDYPYQFTFSLLALTTLLYDNEELICVVKNENELETLKNELNKGYHPNVSTVVIIDDLEEDYEQIWDKKDYKMINGKPTFYLCKNNTCSNPFHDLSMLKEML